MHIKFPTGTTIHLNLGSHKEPTKEILGCFMIYFKINELIQQKERMENRVISLQTISDESGVNRSALSKMKSPNIKYSTTTNTIEDLCRYFKCSVGDVIEFRENA